MRQYRGLTKDGKWVYGSYLEDGKEYYIFPHKRKCSFLGAFTSVTPESIGQSTGLKDKNGKEIYEGDIIGFQSGSKPKRAIIEFQIHSYHAGFFPNKSTNANCYWEIIGNVHQTEKLK